LLNEWLICLELDPCRRRRESRSRQERSFAGGNHRRGQAGGWPNASAGRALEPL